jgi:hypothetical protein
MLFSEMNVTFWHRFCFVLFISCIYHQTTKAYDTREVHIIKSTNITDNENLTIQLSTCQRTSHSPVIKMSTNISLSLSCYPNVSEYLDMWDVHYSQLTYPSRKYLLNLICWSELRHSDSDMFVGILITG